MVNDSMGSRRSTARDAPPAKLSQRGSCRPDDTGHREQPLHHAGLPAGAGRGQHGPDERQHVGEHAPPLDRGSPRARPAARRASRPGWRPPGARGGQTPPGARRRPARSPARAWPWATAASTVRPPPSSTRRRSLSREALHRPVEPVELPQQRGSPGSPSRCRQVVQDRGRRPRPVGSAAPGRRPGPILAAAGPPSRRPTAGPPAGAAARRRPAPLAPPPVPAPRRSPPAARGNAGSSPTAASRAQAAAPRPAAPPPPATNGRRVAVRVAKAEPAGATARSATCAPRCWPRPSRASITSVSGIGRRRKSSRASSAARSAAGRGRCAARVELPEQALLERLVTAGEVRPLRSGPGRRIAGHHQIVGSLGPRVQGVRAGLDERLAGGRPRRAPDRPAGSRWARHRCAGAARCRDRFPPGSPAHRRRHRRPRAPASVIAPAAIVVASPAGRPGATKAKAIGLPVSTSLTASSGSDSRASNMRSQLGRAEGQRALGPHLVDGRRRPVQRGHHDPRHQAPAVGFGRREGGVQAGREPRRSWRRPRGDRTGDQSSENRNRR